MSELNRRSFLATGAVFAALPLTAVIKPAQQANRSQALSPADMAQAGSTATHPHATHKDTMKIQYLEIVTTDVDGVCALYSQTHNAHFRDPDPNFGGARTADLSDGGMLGVRAPLRTTETPVVRPYLLVDDIVATVAEAAKTGAEIAMGPTPFESGGSQFAIVIRGGLEAGFWQI